MANNTTKMADVKDAAEKASVTSGQADPKLEKAVTPYLTTNTTAPIADADKPDPCKVVPFDKVTQSTKTQDKAKKKPPVSQKTSKASKAAEKKEAPEPEQPPEPREAPRSGEQEQIVYINLSELFPFKDHPFGVRKDEEMAAMVESVKDKGVTQAAIVRPREGGGYEMISGHRRQMASELAGFTNMPCIVRNLTDEQAITQMVEDNTTHRESILPSERAKALKMQLDAIKKQGSRGD